MEGDWLTYREAAERLGSTAEAVRYRALRGNWPRLRGNDGRARVQIPDDAHPVRTPSEPRSDHPALVETLKAQVSDLQAHIETLKGQLAAAEARTKKQATEFAERDTEHLAMLTAEQAKTEKAIAAFAALAERLDALAAERARPWWRRLAG